VSGMLFFLESARILAYIFGILPKDLSVTNNSTGLN
jgi:hypothetical protein